MTLQKESSNLKACMDETEEWHCIIWVYPFISQYFTATKYCPPFEEGQTEMRAVVYSVEISPT